MGISERCKGGRTCYNATVAYDKDGTLLGVHRNLLPTYAERYVWGRGDGSGMLAWDSSVGRIGSLICWEHTMNLARYKLCSQNSFSSAACLPCFYCAFVVCFVLTPAVLSNTMPVDCMQSLSPCSNKDIPYCTMPSKVMWHQTACAVCMFCDYDILPCRDAGRQWLNSVYRYTQRIGPHCQALGALRQ